jgi:Flp pilus assembly protein CpaB
MTPRRRTARDERLHRAPLLLRRPRGLAVLLRWLVAAALLGLAGLLLAAGDPPAVAAPSSPIVTARRDLPAGVALGLADLRVVPWPRSLQPRGALRAASAAIGRSPGGPIRAGEPLTDVRLLGAALLRASGAGHLVAAPVRIADPGAVALLRPGDRVDVVAADVAPDLGGGNASSAGGTGPAGGATATGGSGGSAGARIIATDLPVIGVPPPASDGAAEGALVVLATSPEVAARLVGTAATSRLSVTVHSR